MNELTIVCLPDSFTDIFYYAVNIHEVNGRCIPDKGTPLGLEDRSIPDSSISSSSSYPHGNHEPANGRLNFESVGSVSGISGGWKALQSDTDKWIKVLF